MVNILRLPVDQATAAAVGRISMRHGQLDYILRMTIRQLTGVSRDDALDATKELGFEQVRAQVKDYAKKKIKDPTALTRLNALLGRAKAASNARNEVLHRVWGYDGDGNPVVQDDEYRWCQAPAVPDLEKIANDLAQIASELNDARFNGFLMEVLGPPIPGCRERQPA
jgi:hypothetical protein